MGNDFANGWLPTLDVELSVDHSNRVLFRFYEKETTNKMTVQRKTAMNENSKIQIVTNDLIRRLLNTSQDMEASEFRKVVDQYGQKLLDSGYDIDHTRRILIAGIKGYEGKVTRCKVEGRRLRRTAKLSQGARLKKKLLSKSTWFKGASKKKNWYEKESKGARDKSGGQDDRVDRVDP